MFIIFGSPRSGTTLLAGTLSQHPQIFVPGETDFIVPLAFIWDRIKDERVGRRLIHEIIVGSHSFPYSLGKYLTSREIKRAVNSAEYKPSSILQLLYASVARKAGKLLAGDKSPNDLMFVRILEKTGLRESSIKIVHLVRDIRDILPSLRKTGWVEEPETFFPRLWSSTNVHLYGMYRFDPSRYLLLRYEDMIAAPKYELARLCTFLGMEFVPAILEPGNRRLELSALEPHSNLRRPFLSSNTGKWRHELPPETVRQCEIQALEGLITFGYETTLNFCP